MAMIDIKNVSKWYGAFQVLADNTTAVEKGEVVVVCGPSGSGKSTLIKCVNGLEPFQKGEIVIEGTSVGDPATDLPKLRSRVGMVFQNFELFPHMSVMRNLTIGQEKVLGRIEKSGVQGDKGPVLAEEHDLAYWNAEAVKAGNLAPQLPVANEKEKPITVNYDELIKSWQK
jgi:ABC-type polar amino acid transport system ATPase subunit